MDSRTDEKLTDALREYENMRDKTERTYYQNCLVAMGDEVQRLRAKLNVIAFPRRGSPEAGWGVEEIGRFAAEELNGAREESRPVETEQVDSLGRVYRVDVEPSAQQSAFAHGGVFMAKNPHATSAELQAEAERRYPNLPGEESRIISGLFDYFLYSTRNLDDAQVVKVSLEHWRHHKLDVLLGELRQFVGKKGGTK